MSDTTMLGPFEPVIPGRTGTDPKPRIRLDHVIDEEPERAGCSSIDRVRLVALDDLSDMATGRFARLAAGIRWHASNFLDGIGFCGFAFTQFAFPVTGGADLDFDFTPSDGVRSPRAVLPLLARAGNDTVLLAPVSGVHEQVIAVSDDDLTWGWHGDLDVVPAGFVSQLGIYRARGVDEVMDAWVADLGSVRGVIEAVRPRPRPRHPSNVALTHLSYWTDNGAAYWYRTEPGRTIADSVVDVVRSLRSDGVPIHSVELDSWWYDHETPRPITEIGYPEDVPPSGTMRWEPRLDAFASAGEELPARPLQLLRGRLDAVPLILHARHISPRSPYITDVSEVAGSSSGDWWASGSAAHPIDPGFFRNWFDFAARNGVTVIEQDWMLMIWFGVPELRAAPGRALEWQRAMNEHARATGVDLLWCMATPADLIEAARLDRVIAVRTSDDYRFADEPAELWTWFLTVNRLAGALGLTVFKDVFFSCPDVGPDDDAIDGDPHAELEAALAALSGGPVGIGDRIGRTDRDIVMRTCDDDGRLRRVDRPIAFVDRSMFGDPARGDGLAWATTTATTTDGEWTYVLAINTAVERATIEDSFELGGLRACLEWRTGAWSLDDNVRIRLEPRDWGLWLVAPETIDLVTATATAVELDRYVVVESS